jgi:hypothetical protein
MPLTRTTTLRLIKIAIIVFIAIIIIIYAISRSLNYTRGPKIDISEPTNGAVTASTTIDIVGQVERAHTLTINGSAVPIDEQGHFKQTIAIFPGINRPTLKATDQFDRTTETDLVIVGAK